MADDTMHGRFKAKLIETKQNWAAEDRLITGAPGDRTRDRLPPGQRGVRNWPVLDLGVQPDVPAAQWRLDVDGAVAAPIAWSWAEFAAQPQVDVVSDIHCVTAWSRYDNRWSGVATRQLLEVVKPSADARFVIQHGYDGYTANVPLDDFAGADVLLAHSWEGRPLTREHGGPVRLVLPKLYFWKSAKWLRRIEFATEDRAGFWEQRGYHMRGDPWAEERYG